MTYQPTEADRPVLMRALAAAEQVVARVPHIPNQLKLVWDYSNGYVLDLYFHHGPANVASFAHEFAALVTATPHGKDTGDTLTESNATVDGVLLRAWSLDKTADLDGLFAEQRHQYNDADEPPPYASAAAAPTTVAVTA